MADTNRPSPKPAVLIIRDGWGRNPHPEHAEFNAIELASTPRCDELLQQYPWTLIKTSGEDVGLPEGTMGNSEVGHQNIGAGRVVDQESGRISKSIKAGDFFEIPELTRSIDEVNARGGTIHLMGIASDAGVHGLMEHLYACLQLCAQRGAVNVAVHLFTDGRDSPPFSGKAFVQAVEAKMVELNVGRLASIVGRYYAMDRDNRWQRVRRAYDLLTGRAAADGLEIPNFSTGAEAVQDYYDNPTNDSQQGDEFITPRTVGDAPFTRIKDGDGVIFYNYRGDRPREITKAFVFPDFHGSDAITPSPDDGERGFDRGEKLDLVYVTMTGYAEDINPHVRVAFPKPPKMEDTLGSYLSRIGKTQFRCAETEKFPHVTFFFNDYREEPFDGEHREMAQSPKVGTYDLEPAMSARKITDLVLDRIKADDGEDFIIVNYANGDMVGHTGKLRAVIDAVETVDGCVGELIDAIRAAGGVAIVTADHGNAEQMYIPQADSPHTAHTTYDVEAILVDDRLRDAASGSPTTASDKLRDDGRLADLAPTLLAMAGVDQPAAMTGQSLIR